MGLEAGSYVDDLVTSNPDGNDQQSQGDDHLRLIKSVLKNTFVNFDRPFYIPRASASITAAKTILTSEESTIFLCNANGGAFTITLPASAGLTNYIGFIVYIVKTDSSNNAVTIAANGGDMIGDLTNVKLFERGNSATLIWGGSSWYTLDNLLPSPGAAEQVLAVNSGGTGYELATVAAIINLSAFGASLIDDANASAGRTTLGIGANHAGARTISTSAPSGGSDGDIWYRYS